MAIHFEQELNIMKPHKIKMTQWLKYNFYFIFEHFTNKEILYRFWGNHILKLEIEIKLHLDTNKSEYNSDSKIKESTNPYPSNEPILIKDGAKNWTSYNKWNLDFFSEHYGDEEIVINDNPGIIDPKNPQSFEKLTLKNYIQQIKSGTLKYLKLSNLAQKNPELQSDLDINWLKKFYRPLSFGETYYMFIGGKNSLTPLHNEIPGTLYIQVSGQKKWTLYPPEDRIFIGAKSERRPYYFSSMNPNDINNPSFPLQKYSRKIEVILNPGDVLWVPPFTWHYVENLTDSIGIAYKYTNIFAAFKASKILTILFFFTTRPSIILSFFLTRIKKDDYILSKKSKK